MGSSFPRNFFLGPNEYIEYLFANLTILQYFCVVKVVRVYLRDNLITFAFFFLVVVGIKRNVTMLVHWPPKYHLSFECCLVGDAESLRVELFLWSHECVSVSIEII